MMKKILILLAAAMTLMTDVVADELLKNEPKEQKVLIAYYSRRGENYVAGSIKNLKVGNTEVIAGKIQKLTGGTLFRIDTVKAYPTNYRETTLVAQEELQQKSRPKLSGKVENMEQYDVIYLGYPNWWGTMPMAVFTFLESYNFKGKTIVPFCTHEGSGLGHSEKDLAAALPDVTLLPGLEIRGSTVNDDSADSKVKAWIKEHNIKAK